MNVFGEPVDGVCVVLNTLALVDFRFGSFDPRLNRPSMTIFFFVLFNEAPDGCSDKSVRAVELAAFDLLVDKSEGGLRGRRRREPTHHHTARRSGLRS